MSAEMRQASGKNSAKFFKASRSLDCGMPERVSLILGSVPGPVVISIFARGDTFRRARLAELCQAGLWGRGFGLCRRLMRLAASLISPTSTAMSWLHGFSPALHWPWGLT